MLYFALAYRFDNRFVLSLALSTLAAWFGIRLSTWGHLLPDALRELAVVYGALVVAGGVATSRLRVKRHFLDAYLHVGVNAALLALTSGAVEREGGWPWLAALLTASAGAAAYGIRFQRFAFVVYGVVYAYVGVSAQLVPAIHDPSTLLTYFLVTGLLVVAGLSVVSRQFGHER